MPANRLSEMWRRYLGAEDGNVLVMAALGATMLMGCMALSVDVGRLLLAQHQMQAFADAAAMAGALEISTCGTTSNCTAMQNAATSAVKDVGATTVTIVPQCGTTTTTTGLIVQLNNGPCAVSSDPNYGSTNYVEAVVADNVSTVFATLLGKTSIKVEARAEAGGSSPQFCDYVLSPSATNALLLNGSDSLTASCGIMVDSNASQAVLENGSSNTIRAPRSTWSAITWKTAPATRSPQLRQPGRRLFRSAGQPATPRSAPAGRVGQHVERLRLSGHRYEQRDDEQGVYCGGIIINGSNLR